MFSDLKPYERYGADPGQWIPAMPDHWRVAPGSGVLKPVAAKNTGLVESTVLSLSYGRVVVKPPEKLRGLVPESFETYQVLERGDIVVRPTDLQNDKTSLRVGLVHDRGIITSAYLGLRTNGISDKYAFTYLAALDHMKIFYGMGSGLRQNLDLKDFKRLPVPVPPANEQAAIVKYLGHAHARIDRAIAAKRKLVALLEEQKQAVIHQAVTRGLDPSVPFKDSGVSWLGRIPAHWEVQPLKSLCDPPVAGVWGNDPDATNAEDHVICVRVADFDFRQLRISHTKLTTRAVPASVRDRRLLKRGDILVEKSGGGDRTPVGRLVVYNEDFPAITSNFVARYRPLAESPRPMYIANALASAYRLGITWPAVRQTTGIQNLVEVEYRAIPIPIPPRPEQDAIVSKIAEISQLAHTTQERLVREIELLREFRSRLTSDVVTGQVDVREIAATLPDLTGEVLFSADDEFTDEESVESEFQGADE